jgi:hypothetical protein
MIPGNLIVVSFFRSFSEKSQLLNASPFFSGLLSGYHDFVFIEI